MASGLIRLASGTAEFASFSETFHWSTGTPRGFDFDGEAPRAQGFNKRSEQRRFEWFPSSDHRTATRVGRGFLNQSLERHRLPTGRIPGVFGVAPTASDGAALEADEDGGHASSDTFPLDGEEALGDTACGYGSHTRSWISAPIAS